MIERQFGASYVSLWRSYHTAIREHRLLMVFLVCNKGRVLLVHYRNQPAGHLTFPFAEVQPSEPTPIATISNFVAGQLGIGLNEFQYGPQSIPRLIRSLGFHSDLSGQNRVEMIAVQVPEISLREDLIMGHTWVNGWTNFVDEMTDEKRIHPHFYEVMKSALVELTIEGIDPEDQQPHPPFVTNW